MPARTHVLRTDGRNHDRVWCSTCTTPATGSLCLSSTRRSGLPMLPLLRPRLTTAKRLRHPVRIFSCLCLCLCVRPSLLMYGRVRSGVRGGEHQRPTTDRPR
jgi:hypothetical protein